jgi:hypothetical protein
MWLVYAGIALVILVVVIVIANIWNYDQWLRNTAAEMEAEYETEYGEPLPPDDDVNASVDASSKLPDKVDEQKAASFIMWIFVAAFVFGLSFLLQFLFADR